MKWSVETSMPATRARRRCRRASPRSALRQPQVAPGPEVVDRVGEREAEAAAQRDGASASCSSLRRAEQLEPGRALPDRRDRAVAAARPTSSCTAGPSCFVAASRGKCRTFTSGGSLWVGPRSERPSSVTLPSASRRSFAASVPPNTAPGREPGIGEAVESEAARHPDGAELLREALHPAAHECEVAVDPDVRAGGHVAAVEHAR